MCVCVISYANNMQCIPLPVSEGDCQFSLCHVLVAFREQTEKLRLEVGLQQTVVLSLMQDEEIILPRADKKKETINCKIKKEKGSCLHLKR